MNRRIGRFPGVPKLVSLLPFLLLPAAIVAAQAVGVVSYIDGEVSVYRDGAQVRRVDIGTEIRNLDLVETGDDGVVQVEVTTPTTSSTEVSVRPNSSFYFDYEEVEGTRTTTYQVLAGNMAFRVQRIAGDGSVRVRTRSTVAGVRGTDFEVVTGADESVLVAVTEGQVGVANDAGDAVAVVPGYVAQSLQGGGVERVRVSVSDLPNFISEWEDLRLDVFRSGAATFVRAYASRFLGEWAEFREAREALARYRSTLAEWDRGSGSVRDSVRIKMALGPAVIGLRSILPRFELTFYRLRELAGFHAEGIGVTQLEDGSSSTGFFRSFARVESTVTQELADARYLLRAYRAVEEAGMSDDIFGGSSPFGGSGSPGSSSGSSGSSGGSSPFGGSSGNPFGGSRSPF